MVNQHFAFFKSKERRLKLKELLTPDESEESIREKMLAGYTSKEREIMLQMLKNGTLELECTED